MFRILAADLLIDIEARYALIKEWCRDYLVPEENGKEADITVRASEKDLRDAIEKSPFPVEPEEAEAACLSMLLGRELPRFDAFFFHGAVFTVVGKTYAISAGSGTGKTTLLRRCREYLGRNIHLINGDKPILRYRNGKVIAYGTPWCGKEHWGVNTSAPLDGIILLSRGEENRIEEVDAAKSLSAVMQHIYTPKEGVDDPVRFLELIGKLLSQVRVYRMACTNSPEAARAMFVGIGIDPEEKAARKGFLPGAESLVDN